MRTLTQEEVFVLVVVRHVLFLLFPKLRRKANKSTPPAQSLLPSRFDLGSAQADSRAVAAAGGASRPRLTSGTRHVKPGGATPSCAAQWPMPTRDACTTVSPGPQDPHRVHPKTASSWGFQFPPPSPFLSPPGTVLAPESPTGSVVPLHPAPGISHHNLMVS